ncbi:MAG: APC family permease [Spirochaetota bacterium]
MKAPGEKLKRQLGIWTGVFIITADMVGTGIFMTTGNVLAITGNALWVLLLWAIGGITALAGALCYAELATMWPQAGGEYVYLKKTFGYLPAFLTGWVSLVAGFSAPVAAGALLVVQYAGSFLYATGLTGSENLFLQGTFCHRAVAATLVVILSAMHIAGVRGGAIVQNILTIIKIGIVLALISAGLYAVEWHNVSRLWQTYDIQGETGHPVAAHGLALLMIMFAYTGWNAATYVAGEIKNPGRALPVILKRSVILVTVMYILLNMVFLLSASGKNIMGVDDVGAVALQHLMGDTGSLLFLPGIAIIVVSSVSSQMMIGPRVYYAMAQDGMMFRFLGRVHHERYTPVLAILLQTVLAVFYVFTGTAITLIVYMGFALSVFPLLSVAGLMRMRKQAPGIHRPYHVPLYPLLPLFFIVMTLFMMTAAVISWTTTSLFSALALVLGIPFYILWKKTLVSRK